MNFKISYSQDPPSSDRYNVTVEILDIDQPGVPNIIVAPKISDVHPINPTEEAMVRKILQDGNPKDRETLNWLLSRIASASFYRGVATGHNEAVMER